MQEIEPNGMYGFRAAKIPSNKEIWYKANNFPGYALFAIDYGIGESFFGWTSFMRVNGKRQVTEVIHAV